ncbi:MAG: nucleotidyltransferase [Anaerolineae bacterium]|nr:nucleotidyltransferase [Anaerolineae bacterium]
MTEQLLPALHKAVSVLEANGYQYAIIGGIALAQWGVSRYTHDVNLKLLVPDAEYEKTRLALRKLFPMYAREQLAENPFIVAVTINGVIVDFLLALPGYEELIIERAVQRDFGGWMANVCSVEDLLVQKIVAGRDKDWLDVEALKPCSLNKVIG